MKKTPISSEYIPEENVIISTHKQNIANKKIYFDSDGTEVKIGYDDETGIGFVEIISK